MKIKLLEIKDLIIEYLKTKQYQYVVTSETDKSFADLIYDMVVNGDKFQLKDIDKVRNFLRENNLI